MSHPFASWVAAIGTAVAAACCGQQMAAHFEKKGTVLTDTFEAGPGGVVFEAPVRGTSTDGVTLQLPPKAVEVPIRLSLGYCTGSLKVITGKASGVVLTIKTEPAVTFQNPLKIGVSFPPNSKYQGLIGFAIDAEGRLRPIDIADRDMARGHASFLTFQPITFTWIYIEK